LAPLGEEADAEVEKLKAEYSDLIVIDFTHPTAVNPNGEFYAKHKLNYIMGTTGGDRDALSKVPLLSLCCMCHFNTERT